MECFTRKEQGFSQLALSPRVKEMGTARSRVFSPAAGTVAAASAAGAEGLSGHGFLQLRA